MTVDNNNYNYHVMQRKSWDQNCLGTNGLAAPKLLPVAVYHQDDASTIETLE